MKRTIFLEVIILAIFILGVSAIPQPALCTAPKNEKSAYNLELTVVPQGETAQAYVCTAMVYDLNSANSYKSPQTIKLVAKSGEQSLAKAQPAPGKLGYDFSIKIDSENESAIYLLTLSDEKGTVLMQKGTIYLKPQK